MMTYFDYLRMRDLKDTKEVFIEYLVDIGEWDVETAEEQANRFYKDEEEK